jgi:aryl-alcohol dehydrogenase-like predicted oxidoreductase
MKTTRVGRTDIDASVVCMGCWAIAGGDAWGEQNEGDALDAISASLDVGVNTFDTAPAYGGGSSEELLGRALKGRRNEAVIATKLSTGDQRKDVAIRACEDSLRRLQTDVIDIYQIHWPSRKVAFDETADALQTLIDQGKIRAAGVSNFGPVDLPAFSELLHAEVNQIAYSLLFRSPEQDLLDLCAEGDTTVLTYGSLMESILTGKFATADEVPGGRARTRHFSGDRPQARHGEPGCEAETFAALDAIRAIAGSLGVTMAQLSIAWLLHQPAVGVAIVGARNADQANQNAAAEQIELSEDVLAELDRVTQPIKDALGGNLDMWASDSRIQ